MKDRNQYGEWRGVGPSSYLGPRLAVRDGRGSYIMSTGMLISVPFTDTLTRHDDTMTFQQTLEKTPWWQQSASRPVAWLAAVVLQLPDSTTCYPPKPPPTFKHDNLNELLLQRWWRPLTSLSSRRAGHSRPGPHSCRCQSRCSWERCRRSRSCSAPRRCIGEQLDHVSPPLEGGFQAFLLLPHLGADVLPAGDRSPAKCLVKFKSGNDASSMMHKIGRWYFYFQRWTNKTTRQVVLSTQARALLELRLIVVQLFVESNQSENDETSNPSIR